MLLSAQSHFRVRVLCSRLGSADWATGVADDEGDSAELDGHSVHDVGEDPPAPPLSPIPSSADELPDRQSIQDVGDDGLAGSGQPLAGSSSPATSFPNLLEAFDTRREVDTKPALSQQPVS